MSKRSNGVNRNFVLAVVAVVAVAAVLLAVWGIKHANGQKTSSATLSFISSDISSENSGQSSSLAESSSLSSEVQSESPSSQAVSSSEVTSSSKTVLSSKTASSSRRVPSASSHASANTALPVSGSVTILVNKDHPISANFTPQYGTIDRKYYINSSKDNRFDKRAIPSLIQLISDARSRGVNLSIVSGFRTYSYQSNNFQRKVNQYLAKGYTKANALTEAATVVAPPGTSEHETGLAADIATTDWYQTHSELSDDFDKTPAFKWLISHCSDYGFILRYPKSKQAVTKIIYEPWHFRYVGKDLAKKITASGLCYEEYLSKYPQ